MNDSPRHEAHLRCSSFGSRKTKMVSKYEIGKTLGEGRFGKVKYGVNTENNLPVAIKKLNKKKIIETGMIAKVKQEIAIMKKINHPHVVTLLEVMASEAYIYMVLEFAAGGELFHILANAGRFDEATSRRYFQQLISTLSYVHSLGICHRDLKPENLLLDERGNLKISDFGLSSLQSPETLCHTRCGTSNYVAPELLCEDYAGYDGFKADIWACGVILFVFLAGYLPFDAPSPPELYVKIRAGLSDFPKRFPPLVCDLLSRIFVVDPAARCTIQDIERHPWYLTDLQVEPDGMATLLSPVSISTSKHHIATSSNNNHNNNHNNNNYHSNHNSTSSNPHSPSANNSPSSQNLASYHSSTPTLSPPSIISPSSTPPLPTSTAAATIAPLPPPTPTSSPLLAEPGSEGADDSPWIQISEDAAFVTDKPFHIGGVPVTNAFELIALSGALDLSRLLAGPSIEVPGQNLTRFPTRAEPSVILRKLQDLFKKRPMAVKVHNRQAKLDVTSFSVKGSIRIEIMVFSVAPDLRIVIFHRKSGDILEFYNLYREISSNLTDLTDDIPVSAFGSSPILSSSFDGYPSSI